MLQKWRGLARASRRGLAWASRRGERGGGGGGPRSQAGPKHLTAIIFVVQTPCHHPCYLPRPCSPPITSLNITIVAHRAFCPPLPHGDCSYYPCERPALAGTCDWVSPAPPLPLLLFDPLGLLFFLACCTPGALAFVMLPLHLLPYTGADILGKLVPSVLLPQIQTSH